MGRRFELWEPVTHEIQQAFGLNTKHKRPATEMQLTFTCGVWSLRGLLIGAILTIAFLVFCLIGRSLSEVNGCSPAGDAVGEGAVSLLCLLLAEFGLHNTPTETMIK